MPTNNTEPKTKKNKLIKKIQTQLDQCSIKRPDDRIYMMCDKPFYSPGETIWFQIYIRNRANMAPSLMSEIVHIELLAPSGSPYKTFALIARQGTASGDITLDEDMPGGLYQFNVYTKWQQNSAFPAYFEKKVLVQKFILPNLKMKLKFLRDAYGKGDMVFAKLDVNTLNNNPLSDYNIQYKVSLTGHPFLTQQTVTNSKGSVLITFQLPKNLDTADALLTILIPFQGITESISRSVPILLHKLKVELFPEGGELVEGFSSRVGVRVLNEFNKPADMRGTVETSDGHLITNFETFHKGLGAFRFTPEKGKAYVVRVLSPQGIEKTYPLPKAMPRGYTLEAKIREDGHLNIIVRSTEKEELTVVVRARGEKLYTFAFISKGGENEFVVHTDEFPMGVAQVTLFDANTIERAERLVFINPHKKMRVCIKTDKTKYLPREKVNMTISVTDERGVPIPAQLSLAVVDDKLLSFADDKSGNVLSKLLLEPDLIGEVHEPGFYFDESEEKRHAAMDYLMLTHGWRGFTWKKIMEVDKYTPQHMPEKAEIRGTVYFDNWNHKPVPNAKVKITSSNKSVMTDQQGEFIIHDLDLYQIETLTASKGLFKTGKVQVSDYNTHVTIYLNRPRLQQIKRRRGFMAQVKNLMPVEPVFPMAAQMVKQNMPRKAQNPLKAERKMIKVPVKMKKEIERPDDGKVLAKVALADRRIKRRPPLEPSPSAPIYYRARVFPKIIYKTTKTDTRSDFRSIIYWQGNIKADQKGSVQLEFYNSDEITAFRSIVEGIGANGLVGRHENLHYTQLPFAMNIKLPIEVAMGDTMMLPLTIINNSSEKIAGILDITPAKAWIALEENPTEISIDQTSTKTVHLPFSVVNLPGKGTFKARFKSDNDTDAFKKEVIVVPKGFPVNISISAREQKKQFTINVSSPIEGSLTAAFTAYPTVLSDMLAGLESILQEPYGCFEQTSASTYPNIMVLSYLSEEQQPDFEITQKASRLIKKGYQRLTTFETCQKGYEWFGQSPGHEALTAYGLMEFNDMATVYSGVDEKMVRRTSQWLLTRRDGKGGFKKNSKALDTFGRAKTAITNAYIVYALSEAGFADEIQKELQKVWEDAHASNDPYQLALITNALFNVKDNRAETTLVKLLQHQKKDGSWIGSHHSITCSTGKAFAVETTALVVLAALKTNCIELKATQKAITYITKARTSNGGFGNTQSTVLALKALVAFARFSRKTSESGTIKITVNDKEVAETTYASGQKEEIVIPRTILSPCFKSGANHVRIRYSDVKHPLPYTFSVTYNTLLPLTSEKCPLNLKTNLTSSKVTIGETVRFTISLNNKKKDAGLPMTVALIGIPGGLSPQPWQLKEMQEKRVMDYFEVSGNTVIFYYRQMKPAEKRIIHLDLKADIPGTYTGSASCAYLYYTNEYKSWVDGKTITIDHTVEKTTRP
ncbi:MAG: MG2 domain-containing protein [Desulfobacteraceae bacterium]